MFEGCTALLAHIRTNNPELLDAVPGLSEREAMATLRSLRGRGFQVEKLGGRWKVIQEPKLTRKLPKEPTAAELKAEEERLDEKVEALVQQIQQLEDRKAEIRARRESMREAVLSEIAALQASIDP